jgi:hypothetical protein
MLFGPNVIAQRAAAMNDQAAEPSTLQADPHQG